ncbi:MAG: hypothetical protein R3F65_26595 [bacterium]
MAYAVERIAEGHPLRTSLEALFARRALPVQAVVGLRGALDRATLTAAPGAPAVALGGPLYLVHATAVPAGDRLQILGTVSWSDQGLPRMAAGLIDDAVSAGVQVLVPLAEAPELAGKAPAAVAEAPAGRVHREQPTRPERPRARPKAEPASPHLDLSAEMALLEPRFDAIPAPERPGAERPAAATWAADDEDDSVDAPPPERPRRRARRAQSRARRARPPAPAGPPPSPPAASRPRPAPPPPPAPPIPPISASTSTPTPSCASTTSSSTPASAAAASCAPATTRSRSAARPAPSSTSTSRSAPSTACPMKTAAASSSCGSAAADPPDQRRVKNFPNSPAGSRSCSARRPSISRSA